MERKTNRPTGFRKSIQKVMYFKTFLWVVLVSILSSCMPVDSGYEWKTIDVSVSAYNAVPSQTDGNPNIAAWGDTLVLDEQGIAVSRDLIAMGLDHNTQVKIEGLEGIYLVKDKMNKRYTKKIDIFMGNDVSKANEWGIKKLTIHYRVQKVQEK